MAQGTVVVIGSVNTDYVVFLDRRPAPGETVLASGLAVHGGGKGANQAVAAAKSGAPTELVACLGDDPSGDARLGSLADRGVRTGYVRRVPGVPTGAAFITVTPDGENDIIVVPGANAQLQVQDIDRAAPALGQAAVIVAQLEVPLPCVVAAVERVKAPTTVVLNCSPANTLPEAILARVDVLVVNELEASALAATSVGDVASAMRAAEVIVALGPRAAVVTLGPDGAVVVTGRRRDHIPARKVAAVDTTGAGDAFMGALSARLAAGQSLIDAVSFGVEVGTATTQRAGAEAVVPQ
ncbi:MAG TPA: ribokinase [Acidimicrobiales bacterium]|nr:ribokinase [Acidimicrobiales bacterium]